LYLVGGILVLLFGAIFFIVTRIGTAYRKGLSQMTDQPAPGNATHNIKETITKITIRDKKSKGCTEVTPDGIIRIYEVCGTQLTDANRMNNPSNINRLFKLTGETVFTDADTSEAAIYDCTGSILAIETASGTKTVCLKSENSQGGGNGGGGSGSGGNGGGVGPIQDIIDTIKKIIEDIPPTPTITPPVQIPTPTIEPTGTPEPTLPLMPGETPIITPTPIIPKPFTCNYYIDSTGKKRPYNVSNTICSDEPAPGQ
jgi:hypothetical protein